MNKWSFENKRCVTTTSWEMKEAHKLRKSFYTEADRFFHLGKEKLFVLENIFKKKAI